MAFRPGFANTRIPKSDKLTLFSIHSMNKRPDYVHKLGIMEEGTYHKVTKERKSEEL